MNTLIFGAGAVGSYLGANLLQAGWPVTFLARQATARSLQDRGLLLHNQDSIIHFQDINAVHHLNSSLSTAPDLILLTVKAYDCQSAAQQIRDTGWHSPVVSFLNGIGSEAILTEVLSPTNPVLAGTLTTAVERPEPNEVHVARRRGIGLEARPGPSEELARALTAAGLDVGLYSDPKSMKWSKLMSNLIGNATSALTGLTVGEIYSHPGLFRLELEMLREAKRVMAASGLSPINLPGVPMRWLSLGLQLPPSLLQPILGRLVAGGRGGKRPSMYYDVKRGQTEIQWLNGAVVQAGDDNGVATPANSFLTKSVLDLKPGERVRPEVVLRQAANDGVAGLAVYNRPGT